MRANGMIGSVERIMLSLTSCNWPTLGREGK
jgi:hypothetical protein